MAGQAAMAANTLYQGLPAGQPEALVLQIIIAVALLSILLYALFGRDEKLLVTMQNHAPSGLNPSELGYIIDGYVDYSDIVSLLLYWADKGFVRFRCAEQDGYSLIKCKALDESAKPYERFLFGRIFLKSDIAEARDFKYTFQPKLIKARRMITASFSGGGDALFSSSSLALKGILCVFTVVPVFLVLAMSFYRDTGSLASAVIASGILSFALALPIFGVINLMLRWRGWRQRARALMLARRLAFLVLFFIGYFLFARNNVLPLLPAVGVMATVITGICAVFITKRTPHGKELLELAEGLKQFISGAEEYELAELQKADSGYFYCMLPYAYIFGLSSEWSSKFQSIPIDPPKWFSGYGKHSSPTVFTDELAQPMNAFLYNMGFSRSVRGSAGGHSGW